MRLSYNWLKQYVDLSGISPEELSNRMTLAGFEVEGIEPMASGTNLVIGKVLTCVAHPNSDHLHVTTVDIGSEVIQVVCGAPNVAAGQKVIVALPGAKLPGGEIKKGVVRGEESNGMICALFELGVDKHSLTEEQLSGIEVLPEDAPVGYNDPFGYLGLDDVILDVSLTPNRNDCLSMWAMAREVGTIVNRTVTIPNADHAADCGSKTDLIVDSKTAKCTHFLGKKVGKVTIKESPEWMKKALAGAGVKAINNVVDISNYVMLETGQPLHFYDIDKIPNHEITVVDGLEETYTALDGIDYAIQKEDIMITTGGKAIGIAGVMGGDDSKIEESTRGIIIEAAIFDLAQIRNTSRRLNLMTEAAQHFSKGIEPLAPVKAMDRSIQLLKELADAEEIEETAVYGDFNYKEVELDVSVEYLNRFLSTNFTEEAVVGVLDRLNLKPVVKNGEIHLTIPSYRQDLKLREDIAEEVVRLLGYDSVPCTLPQIFNRRGAYAYKEKERYLLSDLLRANGFSEIRTYSLVNRNYIDNTVLQLGDAVELTNPLSEERRYFRTSLLSSQLEVIAYNKARSLQEWSFFEVANVSAKGMKQEEHLCLSMSEKKESNAWKHEEKKRDFYTMKGLLVDLLGALGYESRRISFRAVENDIPLYHPYQSAYLLLDRNVVGVLGTLHPKTLKAWDITQTVVAELNLSKIYESKTSKVKFNPIPKYPSVCYDIALVVAEDVNAIDLVNTIKKVGGKLVTDVEVFDVYRGLPLLPNTKSVAISITYQSLEKTLTDSDIKPVQEGMLMTLKKQFNAVLREA